MNHLRFVILWAILCVLSIPSLHSQNTHLSFKPVDSGANMVKSVQYTPKSIESEDESSLNFNEIMVSIDGNFQHYTPSYLQTTQKRRISASLGYLLTEKTMIGMSIRMFEDQDFLDFIDNNGFGGLTNQTYKRKFQPFVRRYLSKKNNFHLFYELSFNVASEEFSQSRNYYNALVNNTSTSFDYVTFGAHLGLGLEYSLNDQWVAFAHSETIQYRRELNQELSSSENIVFEDGLNMSLFRDIRVGFGYYF